MSTARWRSCRMRPSHIATCIRHSHIVQGHNVLASADLQCRLNGAQRGQMCIYYKQRWQSTVLQWCGVISVTAAQRLERSSTVMSRGLLADQSQTPLGQEQSVQMLWWCT